MKRLVVAPHDPAEFLGGTERVVEATVKARLARSEEVLLFAGSERYAPEPTVEQRGEVGLSVHRVLRAPNETGEVFLRPTVRGAFERLLSATEPDVVEWHHGSTLSMDLVRAARECGVKTIMFLHDSWLSCPRHIRSPTGGVRCPEGDSRESCVPCVRVDLPWSERQIRDWLRAYRENAEGELRAAHRIVAPSRSHAERMQSYFPSLDLRIHVVPHGLLEPGERLPAPSARSPRQGSLRLAHFGNLVPEKGLPDLAAALAKLADPRRVEVDLFGAELTRGLVSSLREMAPGVTWRHHGGYPSFRAIRERVAACDLAVFPSRVAESYGLVVDEALSAGLPVLVSDRGALAERVGKAGRVLAAEDPDAWHAVIEWLAEDAGALASLRAAVPHLTRTIEDALDELDALPD